MVRIGLYVCSFRFGKGGEKKHGKTVRKGKAGVSTMLRISVPEIFNLKDPPRREITGQAVGVRRKNKKKITLQTNR